MQLLEIVCLCLCCSSVPTADEVLVFVEPIERVIADYSAIGASEFVTSKRIAPQPAIEHIVEQALEPLEPPAPAMPQVVVRRPETAEQVVDDMPLEKAVSTVSRSVSGPGSNLSASAEPIDVLMDGIDEGVVVDPVAESRRNEQAMPVVADADSDQPGIAVSDPTDDQFITDPGPNSVDSQDQLKTTAAVVESGIQRKEQAAASVPVEDNQPVPSPQQHPTVQVSEEPFTQPVTSSELVGSTADSNLDETTTTILAPEATTLSEVSDAWTSLNQATRETILMLVQADRMTHQ
jgi:hypothetical protein